jgi:flagellar biosynthesis/type III secretory pathway chaperone
MNLIIDLLEKKHRLYRRLKDNMETFKGSLHRGDEPRIEQLTREREEILRTVDALDQQLARAGYPSGAIPEPHGQGQNPVPAWIGKIKEIWQDIFHLNLECLQFAEVRCRDLQTEMAAMDREVQNVKKYLAPRPYTPRFIDMVK